VRAGEKLGREVADHADVLHAEVKNRLNPSLDQAIADGVREGHVEIVEGGAVARPALHEEEVVEKRVRQSIGAGGGSHGFQRSFRADIGQSRSGHFVPRIRE